ncbi:hypothetical protein DEH80_16120 [Abyssibacter profundi]|uniref:Uncharacterized protein n=1 Tax=Abyssibacter profundi TaxID=2182787 RepID=A0A383XQ38_9GAMM|nr:hypothetical protein DEH80_16120 [Abyssibacter profundi]
MLTACGGGGGSDSAGADFCLAHFLGGTTQGNCPDCSSSNFSAVADDNGGTFVEVRFAPGGSGQATVRATAPAGTVFNSGGNAGALAQFPAGQYENIGIRFQTYLGGVNNTVGTNGEFTVNGNISGNGAATYYSFNPNADFDAIEVVLSLGGNNSPAVVRLHEICGDR